MSENVDSCPDDSNTPLAVRCPAARTTSDEPSLFAPYLLGHAMVTDDVLERYAAGCEALFRGPQPPPDVATVDFVRRHPWSLPFIDAAAACVCPQTLLRKKLLLFLAVVEATPAQVESFTPTPRSRVGVLVRLAWWGGLSGCQALVGLILLWLARRAS